MSSDRRAGPRGKMACRSHDQTGAQPSRFLIATLIKAAVMNRMIEAFIQPRDDIGAFSIRVADGHRGLRNNLVSQRALRDILPTCSIKLEYRVSLMMGRLFRSLQLQGVIQVLPCRHLAAGHVKNRLFLVRDPQKAVNRSFMAVQAFENRACLPREQYAVFRHVNRHQIMIRSAWREEIQMDRNALLKCVHQGVLVKSGLCSGLFIDKSAMAQVLRSPQ
ncbi:Uncharacterised protein [Chromobacterium violaceum]|nr:Uncharacterised protein [Chromobacterium violaceum]